MKVTITFDTDGGKEAKPIKAAKGDTIRLPKTVEDSDNDADPETCKVTFHAGK